MKDKKKLIGLIAGLVCLVLCVVIMFTQCGGGGSTGTVPSTTDSTEETTVETKVTTEATEESMEETTEETTEPEETTGENTEPEETTKATSPSYSGSSSNKTESTEETTETTEPTEAPVFSQAGAEDNPYAEWLGAVPTQFTTVRIPAGGTMDYILWGAQNTIITVEDQNACIVYNGTEYKAVDGIVTLELAPDAGEPVALTIGNLSGVEKAFVLNVKEPLGSFGNPEMLESVGMVQVNLSAGDADGYCYRWTADASGTLTFLADGAVCDVAVTIGNETVRLSECADGVVRVEVEEGTEVLIQVCAVAAGDGTYPAVQTVITTIFEKTVEETTEPTEETTEPTEESTEPTESTEETTEPTEETTEPTEEPTEETTEPTEEPTEETTEPTEPDDTDEIPTYNLVEGETVSATIPVGSYIKVVVDATYEDMILVVNGDRMYYDWYILSGDEELLPYNNGTRDVSLAWGQVYTLTVHNTSTETEQVVRLSASPPVYGTFDNPEQLEVLGNLTATIGAGSEGHYYTWIASYNGVLTVTMSDESGWQYFVNNLTAGIYGDTHWYNDDPVVASQEIAVSAGDEIRIWVSTYDPLNQFSVPEGEVNLNLKFLSGVGTEEDPYAMFYYEVPSYDATQTGETALIPAGSQVYYTLTGFLNQTVTVTGEGAYVIYNGATYYAVDGVVSFTVADRIALLQIGNSSDQDSVYLVNYLVVVGTMDCPEVLEELGERTAVIEAGADGYCYTWTAVSNGTLTVTMLSENWQYRMDNFTRYRYGDTHWSNDTELAVSESVTVTAGDEIQIWVCTFDPNSRNIVPAGEVKFSVSFVPEEETQS